MGWLLYILECKDGTLYTGITTDLAKRVETHKKGKGSKYTRGHTPVSLVYWEELPNKSEAAKRETEIKRWKRTKKLELIESRRVTGFPRAKPSG